MVALAYEPVVLNMTRIGIVRLGVLKFSKEDPTLKCLNNKSSYNVASWVNAVSSILI